MTLVINGCASVEPIRNPAESPRPNPSELVIAPARFMPASKIDPVLRTKEEASSDGAARGAKAVMGDAVMNLPWSILLLPVVVPIAAMVGSVTEQSVTAPEEVIARGRPAIEGAIARLQLQQHLQHAVVNELQAEAVGKTIDVNGNIGPQTPDELPNYEQFDAPMVLEVSVLEFGFTNKIGDYVREKTKAGERGYALTLTTRARLLDTKRHIVLDEMKRTHRSEAQTATEWLQDNGESFKNALDEVIRSNARDIVLEFFQLYYPPMTLVPEGDDRPDVPYYVLRPIYPEFRRAIDLRGSFSVKYVTGQLGMRFTLLDDQLPTFRWEEFPRPVDLAGQKMNGGQFTDVRYELAVYQAVIKRMGDRNYYGAGTLLYRRRALPEPQHHMEEPLQPCGRYAWTVRAHFKLDGQPRVTEWTGFYGLGAMSHPPWHYRRSIQPFDNISVDSSDFYLLFRAPPPTGTKECPD